MVENHQRRLHQERDFLRERDDWTTVFHRGERNKDRGSKICKSRPWLCSSLAFSRVMAKRGRITLAEVRTD